MGIVTSLFGSLLGLDHDGKLVGQPLANLTGYDSEIQYGIEGLRKTTITSAQLLALNATPQIIVPAAPSGFVNVLTALALYKPAGTAYAGVAAGEDLVAKYTDGSGQQCSAVIETTGFVDQTTAQLRHVGPPGSVSTTAADVTPLAAAIVLHLLVGEITTGTGGLIAWAWYRRLPAALTA